MLHCPTFFSKNNTPHAVQRHAQVAYEQVEIAAAFATSRTAAQIRFIDIENGVEAPGFLSKITSESAQALETQRHCVSRSNSKVSESM